MAGMNLAGAFGQMALREGIRQRLLEQQAAKQQQFVNDLALRRQTSDEEDSRMRRDEHSALMHERESNRTARIQGERDTAAGKAFPMLGIGDTVEAPVFNQTYKGTPYEAGFTPERTLPAVQTAGGLSLDRGEAGVQTTQQAPRTMTGRLVSMGTDNQRESAAEDAQTQQILNDPNTPPVLKGYLRMRGAVGASVPAQLFEDPNKDFNKFKQEHDYRVAHPTREPNRSLSEIEEESAARARGSARVDAADNPQNPHGVQTYLLDLRNRYGNDLQTAEQELARAWPSIRQAHPRAAATTVVGSLRSMFGNAPGASANQLPGGITLPTFGGSPPPTAGPANASPPAPAAGKRAPALGERRMINGQLGEWDGRGWKPAQP